MAAGYVLETDMSGGGLPSPVVGDRDLVLRARQGQDSALNDLDRRHRRAAYLFALQMVGNGEDARDVTQEAMLRFFTQLGRFDADRPVRPWLLRIIRNQVVDLWRSRKVRKEESLEQDGDALSRQIADPAASPAADARRNELRRRLWQALSTLPADHREILVLRDYHDQRYKEIASILGIPLGTVMSRLHSARKALRQTLLKDRESLLGMVGEADD